MNYVEMILASIEKRVKKRAKGKRKISTYSKRWDKPPREDTNKFLSLKEHMFLGDPICKAKRDARIALYSLRAEQRLPLFDGFTEEEELKR